MSYYDELTRNKKKSIHKYDVGNILINLEIKKRYKIYQVIPLENDWCYNVTKVKEARVRTTQDTIRWGYITFDFDLPLALSQKNIEGRYISEKDIVNW